MQGDYSYGSGGGSLSASAPGAPSVGGGLGSDFAEALRAALRAKYQQQQPMTPGVGHGLGAGGGASYPQYAMPRQNMGVGPAATSADDAELNRYRQQAEIAQYQAMSQPPPMRQVTGANIIPGLTMDVSKMNAYQRQAYLPNNSQEMYGYRR